LINPPFELKSRFDVIKEFVNGVAAIRRENFDLVISFHRSRGAGFLAKFGGVKKICGFTSTRPFANITIDFDPGSHETVRYRDLVGTLDCFNDDHSLVYETSPEEDDKARQLLRDNKIAGDFVIITPGGGENPGTKMHTKRWPWYKFKSAAEYIRQKYNLPVVAVGSPSEIKLAESINPTVNLAGRTDLPTLASLLKISRLVMANDSGPLYLASAVGAKTVGIYGPSSEKLVAPMVTRHISLKSEVICRPCYLPEQVQRGNIYCPSGNWACMLTLSVETVLDAVYRILPDTNKVSG
jgi:ADP-heptose:LPS heptosyltransferase